MTKSTQSYSPELLAALIRGSKDEITVQMSYRRAVVLRQRLYALRIVMRAENHPLVPLVNRAGVEISWPPSVPTKRSKKGVPTPIDTETLCTIRIRPQDADFSALLTKAGVVLPDLVDDPLVEIQSRGSLESILASYDKPNKGAG